MTHATLQMDGKKFVLVPIEEFRRYAAEDRRDRALASRTLAKWRAGKLKTRSHADIKKELGL